ncbi:DNA-directed RNA polymerase [Mesorhizobium sp. LNJC405B00]|uniref:DNA-directed RNA polymerase n=1 Tax=Mesorhizobium sp. LNJC405B00 TaxID=1287281 RepID=UPI0003CDECD9|nr:DNA-directed RNA polymerase [Mesorhizobium sp. LNJC405B00]ESX98611.1 T3/T7 RNA polymerase [Mesorhizobium sp. LNJC405B00]
MMEVQADLEARMASLGVDRFRRNALEARDEGQATRSRSMQQVLDVVIDPTAAAILKFREDAGSGKAGRRHSAVRFFSGMDASALAFITAKLVLDSYAQEQNLTRIAVRIGSTVELEKRLSKFMEENKGYMRTVQTDLDKRSDHFEHKRRVYMHLLREKGDEWDGWSDRDRLLVGLKLIELLAASTGLFAVETTTTARRRSTALVPTRRFLDWVATLDMQFEIMSPEFLPCVVPPKDWTGLTGGGYHTTAFAYPLALVKTRAKAHKKALQGADLSRVMASVNSIQRTAWAIEPRTLAVLNELLAAGNEIAGLPPLNEDPLPTKPLDIDTNEEARKVWKREAVQVYARNRSMFSKKMLALKTQAIAKEFAQYPAIYFPHQLDFRGRVYSVPQVLNPQGSDVAKGLLVFAKGEPIHTNEARDWFLVHGANSYGVDKVDFDERIAWTKENLQNILQAAKDPLDYLWWTEADSPFVFLTWCFEFAQFYADPVNFKSRVPIAMDGSCNGLQHYSAMLRDPVGGKAVNLVPSDKPQDIYAEVAKVVNDGLYHSAMMEHHPQWDWVSMTDEDRKEINLANTWGAFGIDRSITKRPVMVLPYGGTLSSCQKYVLEATSKKLAAGVRDPFGDTLFASCNWLGSRVWSAIGEVVVAARLAMGWLQDVTRRISAEGPIQWTTPSGFVVVQAYPELKSHQIRTTLLGNTFKPQITDEVPDTIDRRRQANGIAPNFVHALDASALTLTVNLAAERGLTKFAMIHDSYGTTAAKTPALAKALRESFVNMYSGENVLEVFAREVVPEHLKQDTPAVPMVGGLDLSETLNSRYFFA